MNTKTVLIACLLWFFGTDEAASQACNAIEISATMSVGLYGEEIAWSILDLDSAIVAGPFSGYISGSITTTTVCIEAGCYLLHATDSYGDGWQGAVLILNDSEGASQTVQMEQTAFESFTPVDLAQRAAVPTLTPSILTRLRPAMTWGALCARRVQCILNSPLEPGPLN